MRKLDHDERTYLDLISRVGGSFCPHSDADPGRIKVLNDLVKAKRLRVESTDDGPRYHLTAQGRADAS